MDEPHIHGPVAVLLPSGGFTFTNTTPIKPAERQENPSESRFGTGW